MALVGISSVVSTASGATHRQPEPAQDRTHAQSQAHATAYWEGQAQRSHAATVRWLSVVHGRPARVAPVRNSSSPDVMRGEARTWHERAVKARKVATHPPHLRAWYCIHHREGAWTDPNAPYWGGLQMDMNFQQAYGPWLVKHKGTADHWTPLEQIWAGVRAWKVRGFEPWSSSAHACGVY
jgi:hypothetical protein